MTLLLGPLPLHGRAAVDSREGNGRWLPLGFTEMRVLTAENRPASCSQRFLSPHSNTDATHSSLPATCQSIARGNPSASCCFPSHEHDGEPGSEGCLLTNLSCEAINTVTAWTYFRSLHVSTLLLGRQNMLMSLRPATTTTLTTTTLNVAVS